VLAVMTRIEQRRCRRDVAITAGLPPAPWCCWRRRWKSPGATALRLMRTIRRLLAGIALAVPRFFPARND
jgi:hypothetical protein